MGIADGKWCGLRCFDTASVSNEAPSATDSVHAGDSDSRSMVLNSENQSDRLVQNRQPISRFGSAIIEFRGEVHFAALSAIDLASHQDPLASFPGSVMVQPRDNGNVNHFINYPNTPILKKKSPGPGFRDFERGKLDRPDPARETPE